MGWMNSGWVFARGTEAYRIREFGVRLAPPRLLSLSSGETLKPRNQGASVTTVHMLYGLGAPDSFQWGMTRCSSCNGIIAKTDLECYTCQEPIPGKPRRGKYSLFRFWAKPATSALTEIIAGEIVGTGDQNAQTVFD